MAIPETKTELGLGSGPRFAILNRYRFGNLMIVSREITSFYIRHNHLLAETVAHLDYQSEMAKIAGLTPVSVFLSTVRSFASIASVYGVSLHARNSPMTSIFPTMFLLNSSSSSAKIQYS